MPRMISAQLDGKRLDRYEDAEGEERMGNQSEFLRSVLDDGLDAREQTTFQAAELPDRLAAQLEDEREFHHDEADILREVVEDGLVARRGDALDAIDAGEELRATVEDAREDGEALDDATRRLIRQGATASPSGSGGAFERAVGGAFGAAIAVVAAHSLVGFVGALAVVVVVLGVATYLATTAIAAEFRASVGSKQQSHVE